MAADASNVAEAVEALKAGQVVAYPTEALFALAVDIRQAAAVERLRALKSREPHKPLALLVADIANVHSLVAAVPPAAMRLMERFWPGPLTLVFNAAPGLASGITAQTGTVAVRSSAHPVARALAQGVGGAITATNCTRAGGRQAVSPADVDPELRAGLALVLDGPPAPSGQHCTVVDARLGEPTIVREGLITADAIHAALRES